MTQHDENNIWYSWRNRESLPEEELEKCSRLFSEHYGVWSIESGRKGNIKLSAEMLKKYLAPPGSSASLAYHENELVGHAFSLRRLIKPYGYVSWVTQLVVHSDWRRRHIGTRLLSSIWAFSNDFAWGLVTASPITVRTLERATRRKCDPRVIGRHIDALKSAASEIYYVNADSFTVTRGRSKVDTGFAIDQTSLPEMLSHAKRKRPWALGTLGAGEEWLAFTFRNQKQATLTRAELDDMLAQSERILREAYNRMSHTPQQKWKRHAVAECDHILKAAQPSQNATVADFGCGNGRHAIEFAARGYRVCGVDFLSKPLDEARENAASKHLTNIEFFEGDARTIQLNSEFDMVLCLYDVIGSFPDDRDNHALLKNIVRHLKPGGKLVISVMNMELTRSNVRRQGPVYEDPTLLQTLPAGTIMQETGDVFDPEYYLIDSESGIVFRKEQFSEDGLLSSELIVRDRRYTEKEVLSMCQMEGVEPLTHGFVQAGAWGKYLQPTDPKAKEILFIGEKRS